MSGRTSFEPFYTTKPSGMGTVWVVGRARHCRAMARLYLRPIVSRRRLDVRGALSRVDEPLPTPHRSARRLRLAASRRCCWPKTKGTVRRVARMILERHGYHVLEASDGTEALRLAHEHADKVQLLLTDVVMPHLNGPQLAAQLASELPQLKVVLHERLSKRSRQSRRDINSGSTILKKPFKPKDLVRAVRDALDQNNVAPDDIKTHQRRHDEPHTVRFMPIATVRSHTRRTAGSARLHHRYRCRNADTARVPVVAIVDVGIEVVLVLIVVGRCWGGVTWCGIEKSRDPASTDAPWGNDVVG